MTDTQTLLGYGLFIPLCLGVPYDELGLGDDATAKRVGAIYRGKPWKTAKLRGWRRLFNESVLPYPYIAPVDNGESWVVSIPISLEELAEVDKMEPEYRRIRVKTSEGEAWMYAPDSGRGAQNCQQILMLGLQSFTEYLKRRFRIEVVDGHFTRLVS